MTISAIPTSCSTEIASSRWAERRSSCITIAARRDDHLWAYVPEAKTLYTGDLFIWASPNCGNPQKVQRYPRDWAQALRKMAALDAEILLPGHGPPIQAMGAYGKPFFDETASLL